MKLITDSTGRIIARSTDDYTGPDQFVQEPADFDAARMDDYRIVDGVVIPPPAIDKKSAALAQLSAQYDARVQALASGYSQYERESWPVQTAEATAYFTDPLTSTPWLDAASTARGIVKAELAARVIAMDTAYRQIHGTLTGYRQKLWAQINATQTAEEVAAIDVTVGWPA